MSGYRNIPGIQIIGERGYEPPYAPDFYAASRNEPPRPVSGGGRIEAPAQPRDRLGAAMRRSFDKRVAAAEAERQAAKERRDARQRGNDELRAAFRALKNR